MGWLIDLDDDAASRSIADCLRRADPDEPWTAKRRSGAGVVLCSSANAALHRVLRGAGHCQPVVVTRAGAALDPWPLLAAGAADVVEWEGDPHPVCTRLRRLREIDELIGSPRGHRAHPRLPARPCGTPCATWSRPRKFGGGPILITGETGTGKELAAKVAHTVSAAGRSGHLVVVDCTTIVPTLSGSELFGHERGAFTGAVSVRTGACAAANGGTLMLDEVGELPLELQPELLRVVQEGMYKRVGADTWQHSRVPADLCHQPRPGGRRRPPAGSGPTSTTASRLRSCSCRHCGTGRRTSCRCSASSVAQASGQPEPAAGGTGGGARAAPPGLPRQPARPAAAGPAGGGAARRPGPGHPGRPPAVRPPETLPVRQRPGAGADGLDAGSSSRQGMTLRGTAGTRGRPGGGADDAGVRRQHARGRCTAGGHGPGVAAAAGSEPERPAPSAPAPPASSVEAAALQLTSCGQ